jgi:hypothetical protein
MLRVKLFGRLFFATSQAILADSQANFPFHYTGLVAESKAKLDELQAKMAEVQANVPTTIYTHTHAFSPPPSHIRKNIVINA